MEMIRPQPMDILFLGLRPLPVSTTKIKDAPGVSNSVFSVGVTFQKILHFDFDSDLFCTSPISIEFAPTTHR